MEGSRAGEGARAGPTARPHHRLAKKFPSEETTIQNLHFHFYQMQLKLSASLGFLPGLNESLGGCIPCKLQNVSPAACPVPSPGEGGFSPPRAASALYTKDLSSCTFSSWALPLNSEAKWPARCHTRTNPLLNPDWERPSSLQSAGSAGTHPCLRKQERMTVGNTPTNNTRATHHRSRAPGWLPGVLPHYTAAGAFGAAMSYGQETGLAKVRNGPKLGPVNGRSGLQTQAHSCLANT